MDRVILHSDLNSFYASVECLYNPHLRGKPVSVCGSVEERHGIVLASTPEAKKYGVKTGDTVSQAIQKCPRLEIIDPHMERYDEFSKATREIYADYTDLIEPYGLDESWLDVTGSTHLFGDGKSIADQIRTRIKNELGVSVSVGVSFNKSMAKLGSDLRKPDFTNVISREQFQDIVWPLPVSDLLFVGRATTPKLNRVGIHTIGDLANTPFEYMSRILGKHGELIWNYANGIDDAPVTETGYKRPPDTVGNSRTYPRDLVSDSDVRTATMLLAESVAEKLRDQSLRCKMVQVTLRYSNLAWYQRQTILPYPSSTAQTIGGAATKLIIRNWTGDPLRSIGVRSCTLISDDFPQLSLFPDIQKEHKKEAIERAMQGVRKRYGHFALERGIMLADRDITDVDILGESSPNTLAFFRG